ncbi:MAG: family 1 glycosylhydrolase, partial [Erysipelotrichaceae bacterium]|nr:family 1 glycosylhydrolase [Erysipelotrichaceae bacterium]
MSFPKNFLWGGDISANQCEGGWNEGGKSPNETDFQTGGTKTTPRMLTYRNADGTYGKVAGTIGFTRLPEGAKYAIIDGEFYPNHKATDFYHHYKEDIKMLAEMNFKVFNMTLSWARILPNGVEGGINREGVKFYRDVFKELKKYNIEPHVHLYKYDMPVYYIEKYDGWSNRALIDEFSEFAKIAFKEYDGLVKYWSTFNEINIVQLMGPLSGRSDQDLYTQLHHQLVASARVVRYAHENYPELKVGCMVAGLFTYPYTCDPVDQQANQKFMQDNFYYCADTFVRGYYPSYAKRLWKEKNVQLDITEQDKEDLLAGKVDYMEFSYYFTNVVTLHAEGLETTAGNLTFGIRNPYLNVSEWGWAIDPDGLKYYLHEMYDRWQIPLLNCENGLGATDVLEEDGSIHDPYRIEYHRAHI